MGAVADHTTSDTNRGVNIHAIKKHLLFLMARITLLCLSKFEFELVTGCMWVVAGYTHALFNRAVNI